MARDGYRIFNSDTHVGPDAAHPSRYLSEAEKDRLAGWAEYKSRDRYGHVTYTKGQRRYRRRLGDAEPDAAPAGTWPGLPGSSGRAIRRRWSMPIPPRASPTWISREST